MNAKSKKHWVTSLSTTLLLTSLLCFGAATQVVTAQQSADYFSDDFSTDSGSWQYLGSAHRDSTNQTLILTTGDMSQGGVAFFNAPITGSFTANFRYKVGGGGCQGDGFTMFFYKQHYSSIDKGGSLGFSIREGSKLTAVPGYGIEFDGWQNIPSDFQQTQGAKQNPQGDPSNNHIALIKDFSGDHLAYVDDLRVADNLWHSVIVSVDASSVQVYVDQNLVLQWSGEFNRTYDGFGFSGGTGEPGSNWHIIDDFSITAKSLQVPALTTLCTSSATTSTFNVQISGALTVSGEPISDAPILLSYSVTGGETWQELTLIHTKVDGTYAATWLLQVTGDYSLKAVYQGDRNYLGTSNIVNFSIEPYTTQNVFSVTSNSSLSELAFDSASKELSFKVSGESGTTGYVDVCIPNSLINDTSGLIINLDGNQIDYMAEKVSDGWLIHCVYHHSVHIVTINLGSNADSTQSTTQATTTTQLSQELDWIKVAILMFMSALAAAAVTVVGFSLKKKQNNKK